MRFTLALVLGAAVAVSAQSATSSAAAPETSQDVCLKNCGTDVNCKAHCITVPSPNEDQANQTTKCAEKCDQGSGSPEDTVTYGNCVQACINKYYYNKESGTPDQGANPGSGSGSSSAAAASPSSAGAASPSASSAAGTSAQSGSGISTAASGSASSASASQSASKTEGGSSGSQTSASASATASQNAAAGLVGASASFLGFVAALFAL